MPFIAVCPQCDSRMKAPTRKRGTTLPCPKCKAVVPLEPEAEAPPEPAAKPTPTPAPAAVPTTPAPPDDAFVMALVALGLFGASALATLIPYGRIVGVLLAATGLLLAGLCLLGLERRRWVGWAGVGGNAVIALLLVFLPTWVGVTTWRPAGDPNAVPKRAFAVDATGQVADSGDGVDAATAAWQHGDTRLAVRQVTVAPDPTAKLPPGKKDRKERILRVAVSLTNVGVGRAIEFAGWDAKSPTGAASLVAGSGQPLPPKPDLAPLGGGTVYPGKSVECVLVFDATTLGPDEGLRLELPAAAFGGDAETPARFRIPRTMVVSQR